MFFFSLAAAGRMSAQEVGHDSFPAWASAGLGYAHYGTASELQGWIAPKVLALGIHVSSASRGGFDHDYGTTEISALGGLRLPLGPFRFLLAAGAGSANEDANYGTAPSERGTHLASNIAVDWKLSQHFGLHAARFALHGGPGYTVDTFGLTVGSRW